MPLTIEAGGAATVTQTVYQSMAGDISVMPVAEGGSLMVSEVQLLGANGISDLPCDGKLPNCVGNHAGLVVEEGPSAITPASPLVCDTLASECIAELCVLVDYCNGHGSCSGSEGVCTCSGWSGDRCEMQVNHNSPCLHLITHWRSLRILIFCRKGGCSMHGPILPTVE